MAKVRKDMPVGACPDDQADDGLPIVSADNEYGGRGPTLTAVVIDDEKAWFDEAALHGRTAVEQQVTTWSRNRDEVPEGRTLYPVWVYIRPASRGQFQYYGLVANEMVIDEERRIGYKNLADQVNRLEKAMKGHVDLSLLDEGARQRLLAALQQYPEVLANSRDEVKQALGLKVEAAPADAAAEAPETVDGRTS